MNVERILKEGFFVDGSWRDIYALNTDTVHWDRFLKFLKGYKIKIYGSQKNLNLPDKFDDLIKLLENARLDLSIFLNGDIPINCHFFVTDTEFNEIELDLDPKDISTEHRLKLIIHFLEDLGEFLQKDIVLTPENRRNRTIIKYEFSSKKLYFRDLKNNISEISI